MRTKKYFGSLWQNWILIVWKHSIIRVRIHHRAKKFNRTSRIRSKIHLNRPWAAWGHTYLVPTLCRPCANAINTTAIFLKNPGRQPLNPRYGSILITVVMPPTLSIIKTGRAVHMPWVMPGKAPRWMALDVFKQMLQAFRIENNSRRHCICFPFTRSNYVQ